MRLLDTDRWNEIWQTLVRNRKRSIMTALGVFWGIFMLTVMSGLGLGLGRMFRANLGEFAVNTGFFFPDQTSIAYKGMPKGRWWRMESGDVEALRELNGARYVAEGVWGNEVHCSRGERKGAYSLMGYSPDYQRIYPQKLLYGRFINDIDMLQRRKVCVIGVQIWRELFPEAIDPVGQRMRVNDSYYTVVGVMQRQGSIYLFGDMEQTVVVPSSLARQLYGRGDKIDFIALSAYDRVDISDLEARAKSVLCSRHTISADDTKAVSSFNLGEMFEKTQGVFRGILVLTWIVGLGTLLAGIVGVSNIMLVIVRERTQEIGIRRALGAPPRSIVGQILAESFVLTFIAGVVGLSCGVGVLSVVDTLINNALSANGVSYTSWQITFWLGVGSAAIIVAGSLLAGIIPANRALKIKAVDAIREE